MEEHMIQFDQVFWFPFDGSTSEPHCQVEEYWKLKVCVGEGSFGTKVLLLGKGTPIGNAAIRYEGFINKNIKQRIRHV